jgi:ferric-dicitrate binding protein FerR (iron transport regulator)
MTTELKTNSIDEQAARWIVREDADFWSVEQETARDAWLGESALHRVAYLRLKSGWDRADRLAALRRARWQINRAQPPDMVQPRQYRDKLQHANAFKVDPLTWTECVALSACEASAIEPLTFSCRQTLLWFGQLLIAAHSAA